MTLRLRVVALAAAAVPILLSLPASAQTRDPAIATELFNAGRDLMKKGDYASACPKLATSLSLDPKVGTMARLAECEEQVKQLASARAHWQQAINLARTLRDDRLPKVESEFARLDSVVPKVDVELGPTPSPGASLHLDSLDLGPASFGVPVPLDPGAHTVTVTAPGKTDWHQAVQLLPDGKVTRFDVPALADAPAVVAVVAPPANEHVATPEAAPSSRHSLRVAAYVTGGVALATVGVGLAFGAVAKGDYNDSNRNGCNANACTQPGYGERNDARTAGDVSTGLVIAGGVLAAAAITLGVFSFGGEHPVSVAAGPGSLFLSGSF